MESSAPFPQTGFLRLSQIIGQQEITEEQAAANRAKVEVIKATYLVDSPDPQYRKQQENRLAVKIAAVGRLTPCPAIPPIIPISKSNLWQKVREGSFPAPLKLGPRVTVWRRESILEYIEKAAA